MKLEHFTYDSGLDGTHIIFTGAVHGNEPCGPLAMKRIMEEFHTGALHLKTGKVTFIPICNPKAYAKDVRQIDANLNRICRPVVSPKLYEEDVANALCLLISNLDADVLLDVHSFRTKGNPFCFVDHYSAENEKFAKALHCDFMITGWDEAFDDDDDSYGVVSYAHDHGLHSILVECGMNHSKEAEDFAYKAILKSMYYWNCIEEYTENMKVSPCVRLHMDNVVFKAQAGDLNIPENHFVKMAKGDVIATYADSTEITMPYDGYIILPKADARPHEEWFYTSYVMPS